MISSTQSRRTASASTTAAAPLPTRPTESRTHPLVAVPSSERPNKPPVEVLWNLEDCDDDDHARPNPNNQSRPSMALARRTEAGKMITDEKFKTIKSDVAAVCSANLQSLPDIDKSKGPKAAGPRTRLWYALWYRQELANVIAELERMHPILALCGGHWKVEHLMSNFLNSGNVPTKRRNYTDHLPNRRRRAAAEKHKSRRSRSRSASVGSENEEDGPSKNSAPTDDESMEEPPTSKRPRSKSSTDDGPGGSKRPKSNDNAGAAGTGTPFRSRARGHTGDHLSAWQQRAQGCDASTCEAVHLHRLSDAYIDIIAMTLWEIVKPIMEQLKAAADPSTSGTSKAPSDFTTLKPLHVGELKQWAREHQISLPPGNLKKDAIMDRILDDKDNVPTDDDIAKLISADLWLKEVSDELLTPMAQILGRDYFIHEPAMLKDGRMCMPVRWFHVKVAGRSPQERDRTELRAKCWAMQLIQVADGASWRVVKVSDFVVGEQDFLKPFSELRVDVARGLPLNVEGLGLSPLPGLTFVKYAGSLVGRDFRAIAQIAPFVLHGLVNDECYDAWKCLARLVPLIWQPEIVDMDAFIRQLEQEIERFLVVIAKWTARWFNKPKFHILVHLPQHIRRFGPAMLFATEGFESFNEGRGPTQDLGALAVYNAALR
ncbi:hypothetical protein NMY22_g7185 [Coprinellus aureogranulatus]|nr:hypothetical protein NMY22_g7185 [Coprinellus aureogranulatus]